MHDLRLAVRALRATPIVTAVAIVSLALGVGANTAIFSLANALLLRSLPVPASPHLVTVSTTAALGYPPQYSYATFDQIRQRADFVDGALAYTTCCGTSLVSVGGESYPVERQYVTSDFFATLGVQPLRGRLFAPADNERGAAEGPVAVVSYRMWQQRLGGRDDVAGMRLTIDHTPFTVIGVTPPGFFGVEVGRAFDVVVPTRLAARLSRTPFDDDTAWLNIMLRLKPGISRAAAAAALQALQPQIRAGAMPKGHPSQQFLQDRFTVDDAGAGSSGLRQQFERPIVVMFAVVALVLLIACANIGNLLLARGIARRHELSVRVALGASRWQLVRQLLAESLVLSAAGAAIGLGLAAWASRALVAQLSTSRAPIVLDLALDWRVLSFTAAMTAATALLFGVAPALRATRVAPIEALTRQGRGVAGDARGALSSSLIVAQLVLSLLLIVGAGLFVQTFERLAHVSLGFDADRVLVAAVNASAIEAADRIPLFQRLVQAVRTVPGVTAAGGSLNPPIVGGLVGDVVVSPPGTRPAPGAEPISQLDSITPGWLAAYGTAIQAGRDLDERDSAAAPPVMIVNEAFVRRLLPDRSAVGTTLAITFRSPNGDVPWGPARTIVGVAANSVYRSIREPARPMIYLPLAQREKVIPQDIVYIGLRPAAGSPALLERSVAAALTAVHHDLTLTFQPLAQHVDESLAVDRVMATLSGFFGGLALLLAALGLYGVTTYAVTERRAEIGIRMAIGAAPATILRLVLTRVSILVAGGVSSGAAASLWASRFVAPLLYGVQTSDPVTLAVAAGLLAAVGGLAGWLPAWRASRIDPAEALRE
jgi:putative ABC transport system permease protein